MTCQGRTTVLRTAECHVPENIEILTRGPRRLLGNSPLAVDAQCPKLKVSLVYSLFDRILYLLTDAILRWRCQQLNFCHFAL